MKTGQEQSESKILSSAGWERSFSPMKKMFLKILAVVVLVQCCLFYLCPGFIVSRGLFVAEYQVSGRKDAAIGRLHRRCKMLSTQFPEGTDLFLLKRMVASDRKEFSEIIAAYRSCKIYKNSRTYVYGEAFTSKALSEIGRLGKEDKRAVLQMVENARIGRCLYKPSLVATSGKESVFADGEVDEVAELYQLWFSCRRPWAEKQKADPLGGSRFKWVEP